MTDEPKPQTSEDNFEKEIMRTTWVNFNWLKLGQRLYERKMAELNTSIYNPKPYETREEIVFWVSILFVLASWVLIFLFFQKEKYEWATTSLGLSALYTYS